MIYLYFEYQLHLINFFYELFFKVLVHFISNYQYLFKPKFIFDCIIHVNVLILINISLSSTLLFTHNQISGCNKWSSCFKWINILE